MAQEQFTKAAHDQTPHTADVIEAGAVGTTELADNSVTTVKIVDLNITAPKLNNEAVTTEKIAAWAVTADKMNERDHTLNQGFTLTNDSPSAGSVAWSGLVIYHQGNSYTITDGSTADKYIYWDKSLSTTTLQSSGTYPNLDDEDLFVFINKSGTGLTLPGATTVDGDVIIPGTLAADRIVANSITAAQIAAGTITAAEISSNTITANEIAAGTITAVEIAANTITANEIAANTITGAEIAAGSISASDAVFAAAAIVTADIANLAVTTAKIADANITAVKIGSAAVTNAKIQDAAVTTAKINDLAVTTAKIASAAITNAKINDLSADKINAGTLNADRVAARSLRVEHLQVGTTDNLWPNPGFEGDAAIGDYNTNNAGGVLSWSIQVNATVARNGSGFLQASVSTTGSAWGFCMVTKSATKAAMIPLTKDDVIYVKGFCARNTDGAGIDVGAGVRWYDTGGNFISQSITWVAPVHYTTAWTKVENEFTPPSNAAFCLAGFFIDPAGVSVNGAALIEDVVVRRQSKTLEIGSQAVDISRQLDPVGTDAQGGDTTNFPITTTETLRHTHTITVPSWAGEALLLTVAGGAGQNDQNFSYLYVRADIGGSGGQAHLSPGTDLNEYSGGVTSSKRRIIVSPGSTITCGSKVWHNTGTGTWSADVLNLANADTIALFTR